MKTCDNCKHYAKSMAQDPCRNCLPAKGYPSWEATGKAEQTPAERIAELEEENERLKILADGSLLFFAVLVQSLGGEVKISQKTVMDFGEYKLQREDNISDMSYTFRLVSMPPEPE